MKAVASVRHDKKVKATVDTLRSYMATLTHNQVTGLGGLDLKKYLHTTRSLSPPPETRALFLVLCTGTMATETIPTCPASSRRVQ